MAHTTIMRWVQHYAPEFERRWTRFAQPAGASWRVDETYVKVRRKWVYLYRAVDRAGNTVDFRLSPRRDVAAAKTFFRKAIKGQGSGPRTVTLDGYAASHRAVREMKTDGELTADTKLRSSKYLNNRIEQDHRGVKARIGPMLGFKRFKNAAITIAGIELLRRIRKSSTRNSVPPLTPVPTGASAGGCGRGGPRRRRFRCFARSPSQAADKPPEAVVGGSGMMQPGLAMSIRLCLCIRALGGYRFFRSRCP